MVIGSILLTIGVGALAVPVLFLRHSFSRSLDFNVRHNEAVTGMITWFVGAPIGIVSGAAGALILFLSFFIYLDARRKEHRAGQQVA